MMPLDTLLSPRSVAVIGASPDPHKIRGQLLHLLRKNGFPGRIVPVNPSYGEIDGLACVPAIAAAGGEPIDVALIAIPADGVLTVLADCAAASHTASMAGWDAGYDAMFARHGIPVASELDEALTLAAALAANPPTAGGRGGVVTISGGAGAWSADLLEAEGLTLPELGADTQAAIRGFIPSYGTARNLVDLTAGGAQGGGTLRTVALMMDDPAIDIIAVVTTLANPARVSIDAPAPAALLARRQKPVLFDSYTLPSALGRQVLAEACAVFCPSMALLARAAAALRDRHGSVSVEPPPLPLTEAVTAGLAGSGPVAEHAEGAAGRLRHIDGARPAGGDAGRAGRRRCRAGLPARRQDPVERDPAQDGGGLRAPWHRRPGRAGRGVRCHHGRRSRARARCRDRRRAAGADGAARSGGYPRRGQRSHLRPRGSPWEPAASPPSCSRMSRMPSCRWIRLRRRA